MSQSNRLVILDKSFLQAESKLCRRLRALAACGCTFVLTDTLVYELCTGSRDTLWAEAQRKLFDFADRIVVWRHNAELLRQEIKQQAPVATPLDEELTKRTVSWFSRRQEQVPSDLRKIAESARRQREEDTFQSLLNLCRTFCGLFPQYYSQIRADLSQCKDVLRQLEALVQDTRMVQKWVRFAHGKSENQDVFIKGAESGLDDRWFAYHNSRSTLALWCVFVTKYGPKDVPGKEFRNRMLDANYAALVQYADGLASNETSGSMTDICRWLYGNSKTVFSTSDVDAVLPTEDETRLDAYFDWERSGRTHGHDVDDWLSAEKALRSRIWDRLSFQFGKNA